jgi:hypothetical protein
LPIASSSIFSSFSMYKKKPKAVRPWVNARGGLQQK